MKKLQVAKISLLLFLSTGCLNLIGELLHQRILANTAKAFLMPFLAMYFITSISSIKHRAYRFTLAAIFFSWLGDLLLIGSHSPTGIPYFILGLSAFLIAHLMYIALFYSISAFNWSSIKKAFPLSILFLAYFISLMFIMWEGLSEGMKIPVSVYGLIICFMAISAYQMKYVLTRKAFRFFYTGVLFFLLSDSLIGLNKFAFSIAWSGFLIMALYISAQILIIHSLSRIEIVKDPTNH